EFSRGPGLSPIEYYVPPLPQYANLALSHAGAHGAKVAAFAVGKHSGVASEATLVAVKTSDRDGDQAWDAFYILWRWIIADVRAKRREGRAVINMSSSKQSRTTRLCIRLIGGLVAMVFTETIFFNQHIDYQRWGIKPPQFSDAYLPILVDCWEAGIVTVFSAGNLHQSSQPFMGGYTPQRHGRSDNPLITVAAADKYGRLSWWNIPVGPAIGARGRDRYIKGSYSIIAMGEDVQTVQVDTIRGYELDSGTSFAAPQVAGLAAYVLTLPGLEGRWNRTTVARDVKKYLLDHRRTVEYDGHALAYNGIHGDPCAERIPLGPWKSKRRISLSGMASISDYITRMLKRQRTSIENTTLFEDGRLAESKYAKKVCDPQSGDNKILSPKPPTGAIGYKPATSKPIKNQFCQFNLGGDAHGGGETFHYAEMAVLINDTCLAGKALPLLGKKPAQDGKVLLEVNARSTKPGSGFVQNNCMDGFYLAMNSCKWDFQLPSFPLLFPRIGTQGTTFFDVSRKSKASSCIVSSNL
ncbi:MAG: hypothetical protein L6R35_007222, partial [Caloplaca aegaea]